MIGLHYQDTIGSKKHMNNRHICSIFTPHSNSCLLGYFYESNEKFNSKRRIIKEHSKKLSIPKNLWSLEYGHTSLFIKNIVKF